MLVAAALSMGVGLAVVEGAPRAWGIEPWQGVLLGSALYMGAIHRVLVHYRSRERAESGGASWRPLIAALAWRAPVFLLLAAGQAYAYFEWLPSADLRGPYVMLSCWIVAETMLAPRSPDTSRPAERGEIPAGASAPSRRA